MARRVATRDIEYMYFLWVRVSSLFRGLCTSFLQIAIFTSMTKIMSKQHKISFPNPTFVDVSFCPNPCSFWKLTTGHVCGNAWCLGWQQIQISKANVADKLALGFWRVSVVAYFCPLHASYFSTDYVNMQDIYVNMQDIYVNMQDNYVNMQDVYVNLQDNYVNMQLIYVNMQLIYVNMQDNYVNMQLIMSTCKIFMSTCNLFMCTCNIIMLTCKIIMSKCNLFMSTCNLFISTCKIIMLTCKILCQHARYLCQHAT